MGGDRRLEFKVISFIGIDEALRAVEGLENWFGRRRRLNTAIEVDNNPYRSRTLLNLRIVLGAAPPQVVPEMNDVGPIVANMDYSGCM